jgi:ring-1,2-phenylacetyl-CoA epoxidase subunit PaaD
MINTIQKEDIYNILEQVSDPEVPVLSIIDLGVVRDVLISENALEIVITPTYTGCPAMDMIEVNIKAMLQDHGFEEVSVRTILSPAWTTDWLSEAGKQKLQDYGIAPPQGSSKSKRALFSEDSGIICPQCKSTDTEMISQFGSTACKAQYKCKNCEEPFDYFKCH